MCVIALNIKEEEEEEEEDFPMIGRGAASCESMVEGGPESWKLQKRTLVTTKLAWYLHVGKLDDAFRSYHNVFGFNIAVNHPHLMSVVECVTKLDDQVESFIF